MKWAPRTLTLNSKYADIVFDANKRSRALFQLNKPIAIPQDYDLYVSLISASIPRTWYNIWQATVVTYSRGSFTVQPGNYSADELAVLLTDGDVTTTYSTTTGLFTMISGTSFTLNASTLFGTLANKTGTSVSSDIIPKIYGTTSVVVATSMSSDALTAGSVPIGSGRIATVPVDVPPFDIISYEPNFPVKVKLAESYIGQLEVELRDDDLDLLELNGGEWEVTLLFEVEEPEGADAPTSNERPGRVNLFQASN
jgi:hypothetical protein